MLTTSFQLPSLPIFIRRLPFILPRTTVATQKLRSMIEGETVSIDPVAHDVYGRTVTNVKVGRQSVNKAMREATAPKPKPRRK